MAAHRYWRIWNAACASGQTGIGEIEMASSPGGSDLCTGGTAIANGSYGGSYSPSSAFDNNTSSNWFSSGNRGCWCGYDFGSGNAHDIVEVRTGPGAEDNNGMPRIFLIESSDDGSTWTHEWTCYNTSWSGGVKVTFTKPVEQASNRWWAMQCTNTPNGNDDCVIAEIEYRASLGGSDETGSGTPSAFPVDGGNPASNAFDNNGGSVYYSGQTQRDSFVRYDFGSDKSIVQAALTSSSTGSSNHTRCIADGWVLYSQDGLSWLRCYTMSGLSWGGSETKVFDLDMPTPPASGRRRQMIIT